jgi:cellobiose transport system permease protein
MRQYIAASLPDEIVDAATIDGSTFAGTYWRICLPIVRPGLAVLALLAFVESWNSFLWPLLMLDNPELQTISVALASLEVGATMDPIFMTATIAGAVIGTLPLVVLLLLAQRSFIAGIASGAVKGRG